MNREAQSIVVVLLGALMLAITATGRFTAYVKPGFAPLLWVGGGALVLVGVLSLVSAAREALARATVDARGHDHDGDETHGHDDHAHDDHGPEGHGHEGHSHDGHDHDRSRAPWLILAPVLVLLVVAPPALGADSLAQYSGSQAVSAVDPTSGGGRMFRDDSGRTVMEFAPLPAGTAPEIGLRELILRALYDVDDSVALAPVTVEGFVAPAGEGFTEGWTLARVSIACCAADATALRVHVPGEMPYPPDTWVRAVVLVVPDTATDDNAYVPTVELSSLTVVDRPANPYL